MKRLRIDYQVTNSRKVVTDCVTASFTDDIANKLLDGEVPQKVEQWLNGLASLQGYGAAKFCMAEHTPACDETNL